MKVLIFGGSGFVGKNLALHYIWEQDHQVWLADIAYPSLGDLRDNYVGCDIRVGHHVVGLLQRLQPDFVINCAAQTSHPVSMSQPAHDADINCIGHLVVLEAMRLICPDTPIVYTSSSTVVGPTEKYIDEYSSCNPADVYSANKLAAESYYKIYHSVYKLPTIILRFPNLYGPHGKDSPAYGFVNYFIQQAAQGKNLTVYGDGLQIRNLLYIQDAIEAIDMALEKASSGVSYFVAHQRTYTVKLVANLIAERWGVEVEHIDWPAGRQSIDVGDVTIRSDMFQRATGWKPEWILEKGLDDIKQEMDD